LLIDLDLLLDPQLDGVLDLLGVLHAVTAARPPSSVAGMI